MHLYSKVLYQTDLTDNQRKRIETSLEQLGGNPPPSLTQELQSSFKLRLCPSTHAIFPFILEAACEETNLNDFKQGPKNEKLAALLQTHAQERLPQELKSGWTLGLDVPTDSNGEEPPSDEPEVRSRPRKKKKDQERTFGLQQGGVDTASHQGGVDTATHNGQGGVDAACQVDAGAAAAPRPGPFGPLGWEQEVIELDKEDHDAFKLGQVAPPSTTYKQSFCANYLRS